MKEPCKPNIKKRGIEMTKEKINIFAKNLTVLNAVPILHYNHLSLLGLS